MRDLAERVPVDVADQLRAAVRVLAEQVPEVVVALRTLSQCSLLAHFAMEVPPDLSPDELAYIDDDEVDAADERLGIDLAWHTVTVLQRAIDDAENPRMPE